MQNTKMNQSKTNFPQNTGSKVSQNTTNISHNSGKFVDSRRELGPEDGKN